MELSWSQAAAVTYGKGMISGYQLLPREKWAQQVTMETWPLLGPLSLGFKFTDRGWAPARSCNITEKANPRASSGKGLALGECFGVVSRSWPADLWSTKGVGTCVWALSSDFLSFRIIPAPHKVTWSPQCSLYPKSTQGCEGNFP